MWSSRLWHLAALQMATDLSDAHLKTQKSVSVLQVCIFATLVSRGLAGESDFAVPVPAYAASPIYHAQPPAFYHSAPSVSSVALKTAPILKTYEPAPIFKTFEPSPILKTIEASPILKSYAPSPIIKSYEPAAILKTYEPAPLLKYAPAPVAIKPPLATSYSTTTSVHVSHPVTKVAAPVVKLAAAPLVKYEATPVVKYEAAPLLKYAASAPSLSFHSEPIVKYAEPAISLKTVASPVLSYTHETPAFEYAPSYSHGLESY